MKTLLALLLLIPSFSIAEIYNGTLIDAHSQKGSLISAEQLSKKISVIFDSTQKVLASCNMAIVASGTATLEAAILAKPMVVIYKSNKLSNFILSNFFLKTKFISLPNILSQEKIVFELRQNQVSGKEISEKVELTLKNQEVISNKLSLIRDSLLVTDSNKFSIALREILAK